MALYAGQSKDNFAKRDSIYCKVLIICTRIYDKSTQLQNQGNQVEYYNSLSVT